MSVARSAERIGMLERLTSSTAFAVLFGCATLVMAPILLLGLATLPLSLSIALQSNRAEPWALSLLPLIFLAVALGELACAIALGARLAMTG